MCRVWSVGLGFGPSALSSRIPHRGDAVSPDAAADHVILDGHASAGRVIGRLVADELHDRRYVIVDGIDGRTDYVDLGVRQATDEPLIRNTIVEVRARDVSLRDIDQIVADVARRSHGVYSAELHRKCDPKASGEYIQAHVRRLEAMRRQGLVERSKYWRLDRWCGSS